MSVFAALFSSSRAMMTQSHVMERISGNVSNMNTVGYKSFDAHLREAVNHVTPLGKHMSVGSVDVRHAEKQGVMLTTGRNLDLGINGSGFFITNPEFSGSGEQAYTRNGSFGSKLGEDGNAYLAALNGNYVLGWEAAEDGTISTSGEPGPIQIDSVEALDGLATTEALFAGNVDPSSTRSHNFAVSIWSNPDEEGENALHSLVMTWTPDPVNKNTWTVSYSTSGPDGVNRPSTAAPTTVNFDGKGQITSPLDEQTVDVTYDDGTTGSVSLDLSKMTQFAGTGFTENFREINGYAQGRVSDRMFDAFGRLNVFYSNGESRVTHQLALADFPAPQNLDDIGDTMFTYNQQAGEMTIFGIDNVFERTALVPGALEQSTVDLATEFSRMIMTQKAYSCSATVFRSTDEMIRTASDLKG
jgi:flagellar hook protein FlgE